MLHVSVEAGAGPASPKLFPMLFCPTLSPDTDQALHIALRSLLPI